MDGRWLWVALPLLLLACSEGSDGPEDGSGGSAGETCDYQGQGASDPQPAELSCDGVQDAVPGQKPEQVCVGNGHALLVTGSCGSSALCNDYGSWEDLEASADPDLGQVLSVIPIGCDDAGLEVLLSLSPGASTGRVTVDGSLVGIELCHGESVRCPVSYPFDIDVSRSDCSDLEAWYCGHEAGSRRDEVLGN
jgi:hypothetical protein